MAERQIGLIGASSQATEIQGYGVHDGAFNVAFMAVGGQYVTSTQPLSVDIALLSQEQLSMPVLIATGAPGLKKELANGWQGDFTKYIDQSAWTAASTTIGEGSVICPKASLNANARIGRHVLVNVGAIVSHDVSVGDYSTISPGAMIAGQVHIGEGVFIGIGAVIKNNISIASGVVIGAGAVVIHDVLEENAVVVGNPARQIKVNEGWLREI